MKKCKYCQSEIDNKAKICPICKKRQNKKNIYILIISLILTIVLIVGGIIFVINDENKTKSMIESSNKQSANRFFLIDILNFNSYYLNNNVILENIANDVKTYWYDSIWENKYNGDINNAISKALENNKKNIEKAKKDKTEIINLYNKINYADCYSKYCDEIKVNIKEAYDAYLDFYELAISPSGSYKSFTADFTEIDSNVLKSYNKLENLSDLFSKSINED